MGVYLPPLKPLAIHDPYMGRERAHMACVIAERDAQKIKGVSAPGRHPKDKGASDWRIAPGKPGNERRVHAKGVIRPLLDAFTSPYKGDAHVVCYHLRAGGADLERIPRINKTDGGMEWVSEQGFTPIFDYALIDLDNPVIVGTKPAKKMPNTPESIEHWKAQCARPELATFGKYITKNGARLVVPYATAVFDPYRHEGIVRAVSAHVDALGWSSFDQPIQVDANCSDFSRLFRTPHGVRAGTSVFYESPWVDFSTMVPRDFEPVEETYTARRARPSKPRPSAPSVYLEALPADLVRFVPVVDGNTIKSLSAGKTRHQAFASAACALLVKGVRPDAVPAVVVEMARRMGIDGAHLLGDRSFAERTVVLWCESKPHLTGMPWLQKYAPHLALAVDAVSLGVAADALALVASQSVLRSSADRIYDVVVSQTRSAFAKDGVTIVAAPCGVGKTDAATELAQETAAGLHSAGRSGKHAERAQRTAYVAPAQRNVRDYQRRAWEKRQLSVLRLTSPLSERYERDEVNLLGAPAVEGDPVCVFFRQATALCAGGQSAKRLFCDDCEHRSRCRAATGAVDQFNQPVTLADGWHELHPHVCCTHARLGAALEHVGKNGKLICDERPELTTILSLDATRLESTLKALPNFQDDYAECMRGPIRSVLRLLNSLEPYEAHDLDTTIGEQAIADAQSAVDMKKNPSGSPPLRSQEVHVARSSTKTAKILGEASEVLFTVWKLLQPCSPRATLRVVLTQANARQLHLAWTDQHVQALLTRSDAAAVVYDADAHLWDPEYRSIVGDDHPLITTSYATDSAHIQRRIVLTRLGAKSVVTEKGKFKPGLKHVDLVRLAVEQSTEAHAPAGVLVTWKALGLVMLASMGQDVSVEWRNMEQELSYLAPLAQEMKPILATLAWRLTPPDVLWYGATRGNDEHRTKPFVATIGDPIPNIHATETIANHLGIDGATLGARQARAELGQAHGRIRPARRTESAFAAHVGRGVVGEEQQLLYPEGWQGTRFEIRSDTNAVALRLKRAA